MMEDVTKKTIRTIETIETIKHNQTMEKTETIAEQSFYISLGERSKEEEKAMLNLMNENHDKHALGISIDDASAEKIKELSQQLLHLNDSGIIKEGAGVLDKETGHIHDANFYLNVLHKNETQVNPGRSSHSA